MIVSAGFQEVQRSKAVLLDAKELVKPDFLQLRSRVKFVRAFDLRIIVAEPRLQFEVRCVIAEGSRLE
jgi:hypothetical protein